MSSVNSAPADGRSFTTYVSASVLNENLAKRLGAKNDLEFRMMLQQNPELGKPPVRLPPKPRTQSIRQSHDW